MRMTTKHFVLLAAIVSLAKCSCPSMCTCTETAVLCIKQNIESIPSFESLNNDPIIIDLSGNKINMIDGDDFSFDKSDKVIEIYLNNTELLDIDSNAFDELENLQELYLGENLLNSVPETLIEDLSNMILLDISNNHFSGNLPKIISGSLEVLAVANSKVTHVPVDSLKYLPNLKMLLLQQNNIKTINSAVFRNVETNSLFVRLSYNAWDCSCDNIELFDYLAIKNFIDTSDPYQCLTNEGNYLNIYKEGTIEIYKDQCSQSFLKNQISADLTLFKENRIINENDKFEHDEYNQTNDDKSYSLVKDEQTDLFEDWNEDDDSLYVDENQEKEDDILVQNITFDEEFGFKITEFGKNIYFTKSMSFNIGTFIAVLCSFFIGILFGFCINQFANRNRYRSLETSDSRTKLIVP